MLPAILPQLTDAIPLDPATEAPQLLPEQATEPEGTFAGFLSLRLDVMATPGGESLPDGGSPLPLAELPTDAAPQTADLAQGDLPDIELAGLSPVPVAKQDGGVAQAVTPIWTRSLQTLISQSADAGPSGTLNTHTAQSELPDDVLVGSRTATDAAKTLPPGGSEAARPLPAEVLAQRLAPATQEKPAKRVETDLRVGLTKAPSIDGTVSPARAADKTPLPEIRPVVRPEAVTAETRLAADQILPRDAGGQTTTQTTAPQALQATTTPATFSVQQPANASTGVQQLVPIEVPVRDQAWGSQLGDRVLMMAGSKTQTAEIRLTPAEMGPVRVQVSVEDGNANLTFQAQHAVTRDAIEQALPRLRELLAENGITLSQTSVGEQGTQQGKRDAESAGGPGVTSDADLPPETEEQSEGAQSLHVTTGLVDTFA